MPGSGDPNVTDVRENLFLVPGVTLRLTRNLDKDRGFVNGAIGRVLDRLDEELSGMLRKSMTCAFWVEISQFLDFLFSAC